MGILDEAIREHLELKRQHGAGDSELQQLEDDAFGPPDRPGDEGTIDPFAEAPTEFLAMDEANAEQTPDLKSEFPSGRLSPNIADLQEPPYSALPAAEDPAAVKPAEGEQPASKPEVAFESGEPTTDERRVIAEQPTELFDLEEEIAASDAAAPSDEQLAEEEIAEPRLAPVDPFAGLGEPDPEPEAGVIGNDVEDEDEDYFDEQRLSDELDQALEAPIERLEVSEGAEGTLEGESTEEESESEPGDDRDREDDVLEDTPDFLEDSDDDQLWFEQKPPKDFDFDD